jgi:hypothetical protein
MLSGTKLSNNENSKVSEGFQDRVVNFVTKSHDGPLFGAGLILAACFLWTIVLPGVVAYRNGVFFTSDIASRLIANNIIPTSATIKDDQMRKRMLMNLLQNVNSKIGELSGKVDAALSIKTLMEVRDNTEKDLKAFKSTITVFGFFEDPVNVVFVINYGALLFLAFITPSSRTPVNVRRTFLI